MNWQHYLVPKLDMCQGSLRVPGYGGASQKFEYTPGFHCITKHASR